MSLAGEATYPDSVPTRSEGESFLRRTGKALLRSPAGKYLTEWVERGVPPLRSLHKRLYRREFGRIVPFARRFYGVFDSFEEAIRAVPGSKPIGFDNPDAARLLAPAGPVWLTDYPVMFWLGKALAESPTVLDIGGYVGISYYSFRKYVEYPKDLVWVIYDVPAVAEVGREIALRENSEGLSFISEISPETEAHTVIACGSFQFVDQAPADMIRQLKTLPRHLIINKTPLTERPEFVTLEDLGPSACPYRIFNRRQFIDSIENLGYQLIDSWQNAEFGCEIPFYPEHCVPKYTGLYFRATNS
jgi:putative methyltransferase (TIGR04325 family)